jgi:hypothetical protein
MVVPIIHGVQEDGKKKQEGGKKKIGKGWCDA